MKLSVLMQPREKRPILKVETKQLTALGGILPSSDSVEGREEMSWTYFCPHCGAGLNPHETIILVGEHQSVRTLAGFHPQPGNYHAYFPPGVEVHPGSRWDFFCPVCQASLVTEVSNGLCALDGLHVGKKHRVYFSRVAGEHATFVVSAEGILETHGQHAPKHSLDLLDHI